MIARRPSIQLVGLAAAAAVLLLPSAASAAAPRYIVAHDGPLAAPVTLADWEANLRLLTVSKTGAVIEPSDLAGREEITLSLFWGPEWAEYADRTGSATPPLERANDTATVYIATSDAPAAIRYVFDGVTEAREMPPDAVAVLESAGIPVGFAGSAGDEGGGGALDWPLFVGASALFTALVATFFVVVRRRGSGPGGSEPSPIGAE
jgi:hypothetical protein